jgi:Uma2 family endonuclease
VCGEPIFEELQGIKMLVNPLVLIEVLSPSTEGYDLGKKFTEYKSIASFREYLAVSQSRPHVIRYFRHADGFWVRHDIEGLENDVLLESLNVSLPLSEIYERVNFAGKV